MRAIVRYALRSLGRRLSTASLLAVSLGIAFGLPGAVRTVVAAFEGELTCRADAAPLVLGAAGSRSDLVLHALYFRNEPPGEIRVSDRTELDRQGLAGTVPICVRATVRGVPLVGTDGGYFKLRSLTLARGEPIQRLADCVVGADAAERLGLSVGDKIPTDPANLFGASGGVPVRLRVTGILARAGTADDAAAFASLETAWLVAGLGHAHESKSASHTHDGDGAPRTSSGYVEVTDENVKRFHFHGNKSRFPLTAVIATPRDEQARLLLVARYASRDGGATLAESDRVLRDLMEVAVRVRRLFEANAAVTVAAMLALCGSLVALTVRLRWSEVRTMQRLGLSRPRIVALFGAELAIVVAVAASIAAGISAAAAALTPALFGWLVR